MARAVSYDINKFYANLAAILIASLAGNSYVNHFTAKLLVL